MRPIRLGTRGSRLALWQAGHVADRLRPVLDRRSVEIVEIETAGDQVRDVPLPQLGGEGAFTKEIQKALLAGRVDIAVHSLKDLPTLPVAGLLLAAVPPRGSRSDVLISRRHPSFDALPRHAVVGTSSLRRQAQALARRPDLRLVNVRGNIETRLRKLDEGGLDALILAEAGLARLGLEGAITERLDPTWMLPAVGQGALGLECRAGDAIHIGLAAQVDDSPSHQAVLAERALLRALGGGCQMPIGAAATVRTDRLHLRAAVVSPDGKRRVEGEAEGPARDAEALGQALAQELLGRGAAELLAGTATGNR